MSIIHPPLPDGLTPIQRILLLTDGTVTDLLSAYIQEPIELIRLKKESTTHPKAIEALEIRNGTPVIHRHSIIRGKRTKKELILATSTLVPERLPDRLKEKIILPEAAIGQAIKSARIETYREILEIQKLSQNDAESQDKNNSRPSENFLLQRTYRIFMNQQPCIYINECFSSKIEA